jgi:hypothetical protein
MKMMAGVLVVTAVLLSACGTQPLEGNAGAVEPSQLRTNAQALRGDCFVSVTCGDGSVIDCTGTATSCSSGFESFYGLEYVECNGTHEFCPTSTGNCLPGKRCRTNNDCGVQGVCTTQATCSCFVD